MDTGRSCGEEEGDPGATVDTGGPCGVGKKKEFINISFPSLPFLGRERRKRKCQDQLKALEKEKSCEHLGLGLHHSFVLPEPASKMPSERGSILCPDDPRALGLWE